MDKPPKSQKLLWPCPYRIPVLRKELPQGWLCLSPSSTQPRAEAQRTIPSSRHFKGPCHPQHDGAGGLLVFGDVGCPMTSGKSPASWARETVVQGLKKRRCPLSAFLFVKTVGNLSYGYIRECLQFQETCAYMQRENMRVIGDSGWKVYFVCTAQLLRKIWTTSKWNADKKSELQKSKEHI